MKNSFLIKIISLKKFFFGLIFSNKIFWKLINKNGIKKQINYCPKLNSEDLKILENLIEDGVAVCNLEYFSNSLLQDMISWKDELKINKDHQSRKEFLTYYLGGSYDRDEKNIFKATNPLINFSINNNLLNIVNSYFKMFSKLIYLELNETKIVDQKDELKASQAYHRDPGIHGCIKVFVYLNDVEKGGGAFTYVKKSHIFGKNKNLFRRRFFGVGGVYIDEKELMNKIDKKNIYEIQGKSGTVIIADTSGIHKGGFSTQKSRIMTTSVYYPSGEFYKSKLDFRYNVHEKKLKENQVYALKSA